MNAALSAILNGEPLTESPAEAEPKRKPQKEEKETPPDRAELKGMMKEAASLAVKEFASLAEDESETEPEPKNTGCKAAKAATLTEEQQEILYADEERKAVSAALKEVFGEDVQVIDNPNEDLSEETPYGEPQYVAWIDKNGNPVCSVLVNPETLEEMQKLTIENDRRKEIQKTSKAHMAKLKKQGLLDIDNVLAVCEKKNEEVFNDEEEHPEKAKEVHGIPTKTVIILAGSGLLILLAYMTIKTRESKAKLKKEEARKPNSIYKTYLTTEGYANNSHKIMQNILKNNKPVSGIYNGSLSLRGGI